MAEVFLDYSDVAQELLTAFHGNDDKEIVDVATIMLITKIELDKTVELVEKDVGEELAGKVADDNTALFGLVKKAFVGGELIPVASMSMNADTVHRFVVDNFVPDVLEQVIKLMFVGRITANIVVGVGELAMEELAI